MSLPVKLLLAPLLLAQAVHARRSVPVLPEAAGPREGVAGAGGPGVRLLLLGDSSAAGVGVASQDQALAGRLSLALADRLGQAVRWQLLAATGLSSAQLLPLLAQARPADLAVVVSGVNDVLGQVRVARALAARAALARQLEHGLGVRHVVMTAVPPMQHMAGLPQPLRWVLGRDAARHDAALARWAAAQPRLSHWAFEDRSDPAGGLNGPDGLAADRFHPGAALYRRWGQGLAEHLALQWPGQTRQG